MSAAPKRKTSQSLRQRLRAAQQENAELRRELEELRASASFRLGHAVVRSVRVVVPRRRRRAGGSTPSAPPAPAPPVREEPEAAGTPDTARQPLTPPAPRPPFAALGAAASVRDRAMVRPLPPPSAEGLPPAPIFVGGTGRSGTWALGGLLGAHPRWVTVHTELGYHAARGGLAPVLAGEVTPSDYRDLVLDRWMGIQGADGHAKGLQLVLSRAELRACLDRFLERATEDVADALGQLLLEVVEPYVRSRGGAGWTETTPANAEVADALLHVLPGAKLVHAVRDGRDVAASASRTAWRPGDIDASLEWWAQRLLAADAGTAAVSDRVHVVRLEELVHLDRDGTVEGLLAFTGFADVTPLRDHFDRRILAEKAHVGRWRGQVSSSERDRMDGRYRELLDELRELGVTSLPTDPDRVDELVERVSA